MPFSQRKGGNNGRVRNINNGVRNRDCLIPKQTKYIYKKLELGSLINKETIKEEIDSDAELDRIDDDSGDKNLYRELIVNNATKLESTLPQMEQWSILSNVINYVQYSKNPKDFHVVTIKPVNNRKLSKVTKGRDKEDLSLRLDLTETSDRLKKEYLDKYEGVISEILNTTRFDENTDLSTAYLGKSGMIQEDNLKVEEKLSITEQGYTVGKLLDGTECQIF